MTVGNKELLVLGDVILMPKDEIQFPYFLSNPLTNMKSYLPRSNRFKLSRLSNRRTSKAIWQIREPYKCYLFQICSNIPSKSLFLEDIIYFLSLTKIIISQSIILRNHHNFCITISVFRLITHFKHSTKKIIKIQNHNLPV